MYALIPSQQSAQVYTAMDITYRSWFSSCVLSVLTAFAGGIVRCGGIVLKVGTRAEYRSEVAMDSLDIVVGQQLVECRAW